METSRADAKGHENKKDEEDYEKRASLVGLNAGQVMAMREAGIEDPVSAVVSAQMNPVLGRLLENGFGISFVLEDDKENEGVPSKETPPSAPEIKKPLAELDVLAERIRTEPGRVRKEVKYSGGNIPVVRQFKRRKIAADIAEVEERAAKERGEYYDGRLRATRQRAILNHLVSHDRALTPVRRVLKQSRRHISRYEPNMSIRNKTAHDILIAKKRQDRFDKKEV